MTTPSAARASTTIPSAGPIPLLGQQFGMYLAANGGYADPNTLYSVWGGANDIFYATVRAPCPTSQHPPAWSAPAAQDEVNLLGRCRRPARNYVLVFNLPDIGKTPSGLAAGPANSANLTALSLIYNGILNTGLQQLSNHGPEYHPGRIPLLWSTRSSPTRRPTGSPNVTDAACGLASSSLQCGPAGSGAPYTYPTGAAEHLPVCRRRASDHGRAPHAGAVRRGRDQRARARPRCWPRRRIAASDAHLRTVRTNALQCHGCQQQPPVRQRDLRQRRPSTPRTTPPRPAATTST